MCAWCACNTGVYVDIVPLSFVCHCCVQVNEDDQQYWDTVRYSLEAYREAVRVRKTSVWVVIRQHKI